MTVQIQSLHAGLAKIISLYPDKIALFDNNKRSISYRELDRQISQAHNWLRSIGMQPGDTLIALMPNVIETVVLFLACLRGGLTYAPLPCTATITEISRWKSLTNARFCVFAEPVNSTLQKQIQDLDWKANNIPLSENAIWQSMQSEIKEKNSGRLVIPSSGSTGEPKALLLDADRLWSSALAFLKFHQIENGNLRIWNYLPMSYLGGLFNLILIPLAAGGSIFIDDAFNGKTFLTFWSTVERFKINSLWLVPTILRGLLTLANKVGNDKLYSNIEYCFLGTAPVSLAEKEKIHQIFGIQPLENFGLSETTFISSESLNTLRSRQEGSVGTIMPNVEIKFVHVIDEEKSMTEIWVKTPYQMLGYLNNNGEIELTVDKEGFLPTGDFGEMINGQLKLSGRRRDIIKKGGILVALREIEIIAESHPDVVEASAVMIEHPFYGESYVLYVRVNENKKEQENIIGQLSAWLHGQLVRHKWPEEIVCCDNFPRTASGKIQKHRLKNWRTEHV